MGRFHRIFGICQQLPSGRLLRGQIFFEELQAGDGIKIILAFLKNSMLRAYFISTAERFKDLVCSYCFQNTEESFRKPF